MRLTPHWITGLALTLMLAACNNTPSTGSRPDPYANGAQYPWNTGITALAASALTTGYLSDQQWTYASNGWGPIERDKSNGEQLAGDGRTLSINGKTYAKGLGVHADSAIKYILGAGCTRFTADIGLDDEVRNGRVNGSVAFTVFADGVKIYDSGTLTKASATKIVDVDVTGRSSLSLYVGPTPDNNFDDHADWANAKVTCATSSTNVVYLSDLKLNYGNIAGTPVVPTNGWGPIERDMSNGENLAGDGRTISIRGQKFAKGLGLHADALFQVSLIDVATRLNCMTGFLIFRATVGIDDETNGNGAAAFTFSVGGISRISRAGPTYQLTGKGAPQVIEYGIAREYLFDGSTDPMTFYVNSVGGNNYSAHVSLGDARFECAPSPTMTLTADKTVLVGPGTVTFTATVSDPRFVRVVYFFDPRGPINFPPPIAEDRSAPYAATINFDVPVNGLEFVPVAARAYTDAGALITSNIVQIQVKKAP
jgi:NPCBM/NEW2 domain